MTVHTGGTRTDLACMRGRIMAAEITIGGVTIKAVAGAVGLGDSVEQSCFVGMAHAAVTVMDTFHWVAGMADRALRCGCHQTGMIPGGGMGEEISGYIRMAVGAVAGAVLGGQIDEGTVAAIFTGGGIIS